MEFTFKQYAFSPSGRRSYTIEMVLISPTECSIYMDKEKFCSLCEVGCPNYSRKWSCPPYAPAYTDYIAGWEKLFILYLHTEMEQYSYIKNDYLKIKAANTMLKSRADKFLRKVAAQYGSYISTGSCRLCKPCKCKTGLPCKHPDIMTYSFEALGVDVSKLVEKCFQKPLLWYKPHCLPEYTSVVCGLLTNEELTVNDLHDEYLHYITN